MHKTGVKFSVMVCMALAAMQLVFVLFPFGGVVFFNRMFRPLTYAVLTAVVFAVLGKDSRPVKNSFEAHMATVVCLVLYGGMFIFLMHLFGAGTNMLQPGSWIWARNHLWEAGTVVVLGELLRYRLFKATDNNEYVVFWLTLVLGLVQVGHLHEFVNFDFITPFDLFFVHSLVPLMVSVAAGFFVIRGTLICSLGISTVYIMTPLLSPLLPQLDGLPWALVNSVMLLFSVLIMYFLTNEKGQKNRALSIRAARYQKKPVLANSLTFAALAVVISFFLGYFPIYPVVILTDSMTGTFNQGSIVFMARVAPGEAFERVGEGYVIHFTANNLEWVHRAVDFRHGEDGRREYITQGDANPTADPFNVTEDDVMGVAVASLPFLGWPYLFFRALFRGSVA